MEHGEGRYHNPDQYDAADMEIMVSITNDLLDALRDCQKALEMMIAPDAIKQTTVTNAFAAATAAESKARSAIERVEGRA